MQENDVKELAASLRHVLPRLYRRLKKLSPDANKLTPSERNVLALLSQNGDMLASEMAVIEGITPQSMGAIIKSLLALDLIVKTPSETDKRKIYLSVSAEGKKMIQKVRKEKEDWLAQAIEKTCSEKEKAILMKAIEPLSKLIASN